MRWSASMAWDRDGDAHDGETCFALIGDSASARSGTMLRDQGYAEKSPATSTFSMRQGWPDSLHELRDDDRLGALQLFGSRCADSLQHGGRSVQQRVLLR